MQFVQTVAILIIAFVPIRGSNGPNSCYTRCMPALIYAISIILFILIPSLVMIGYIIILINTKEAGPMFAYFTFYALLSILIMMQFFISFIDVFDKIKTEHASMKVASRELYDRKRGTLSFDEKAGQNLGSTTPMREDMYSLMFISMVRPQYQKYCELVYETGHKEPSDVD